MHRRLIVALPMAVLLLAGLVVAGCGSSSSSTSTETTVALTKAEYAKQGNAICEAGNKKAETESKALGNNPSKAEFEKFVSETEVPNIQQQINGVATLKAPAAYEATAKELITTAQATLNKLKADPGLIAKGGLFASTNKLAKEVGLTACAAES
jgi:hypothetical protein